MKKILKGLICAGLCGVMALGLAGCKKNTEHRDPESSPLRLAIGAVDQKFNPLFYTSLNDGEIANMTQVSLITTDAAGKFSYGNDFPVVALDYKETYYSDENATNAIGSGNGTEIKGQSSKDGSTSYEFVIKKGVKFSDGKHDLTVMDVLFNLYVYLDPAYSGSSTIYSTKIKGLQAYRTQDENATGGASSMVNEYYTQAVNRSQALIDWSTDYVKEDNTKNEEVLTEEQKEDIKVIKARYKEELESDWNSASTGWVESYKEYKFTECWQAFFFMEGIVKVQTETVEVEGGGATTVEVKDENGKKLTTLDADKKTGEYREDLFQLMEEAATQQKIDAYMAANEGVNAEDAKLALWKEAAVSQVYDNYIEPGNMHNILERTQTASTMLDYFALAEMSKDKGDELLVPNVSGITVYNTKTTNNEFERYDGEKVKYENYDVLKITIDGIDPKAKWNFGFTVAPMYYYSDEAHYNAAMESYNTGAVYTAAAKDFGVEYKDIKWLTDVVTAPDKNSLPMGAGAYKCCSNKYDDNVKSDGSNFFYNNYAFYSRNDYFTTLGDGIDNAKIKFVTYKVTRDDKIVEALIAKELDYGTPVATSSNQQRVQTGTLEQISYLTGGYGYVGINPKYVPDMEVRKAIMKAFDTDWILQYYGEALVNLINRPISTTSWAYPKGSTRYYKRVTNPQEIIDMIANEGNWQFNESDHKFYKNGQPLKLTFTIAGETTDHPSFRMFVAAETFLEQCGFDISVETDVKALQKLVTGDLAVWAAAWSSSIDPDPYQIYSINSNATSTKNWYKDGILRDPNTYDEEYEIAGQINDLIEAGRETLSEEDRKGIYAQCFDKIMDLAVEFPTYQRRDLCVYNGAALDSSTMTPNPSYNMGPISELWKLNYKK